MFDPRGRAKLFPAFKKASEFDTWNDQLSARDRAEPLSKPRSAKSKKEHIPTVGSHCIGEVDQKEVHLTPFRRRCSQPYSSGAQARERVRQRSRSREARTLQAPPQVQWVRAPQTPPPESDSDSDSDSQETKMYDTPLGSPSSDSDKLTKSMAQTDIREHVRHDADNTHPGVLPSPTTSSTAEPQVNTWSTISEGDSSSFNLYGEWMSDPVQKGVPPFLPVPSGASEWKPPLPPGSQAPLPSGPPPPFLPNFVLPLPPGVPPFFSTDPVWGQQGTGWRKLGRKRAPRTNKPKVQCDECPAWVVNVVAHKHSKHRMVYQCVVPGCTATCTRRDGIERHYQNQHLRRGYVPPVYPDDAAAHAPYVCYPPYAPYTPQPPYVPCAP